MKEKKRVVVVGLGEVGRPLLELATEHYENFHVATFLLPKRLHQDFYNVYSFCRWADDLGDEIGDTAESLREKARAGLRREKEAERRRHRGAKSRVPRVRLRRLDSAQPAGGAESVAPLRRGSAAAPIRPIALTPPK